MSKRNKIILGTLILIYVLALIVFHATYSLTTYWIEESSIIIPGTIIYFGVVLILYKSFNKNETIKLKNNMGVKGITKLVAYASLFKAIICLFPFLYEGYIYSIMLNIHAICWIVISFFFFILNKNMQ